CGCCRHFCGGPPSEAVGQALATAEAYADGRLTREHLTTIEEELYPSLGGSCVAEDHLAFWCANPHGYRSLREATRMATKGDVARHRRLMIALFGNPDEPAKFNPGWLGWNDRLIPKLAEAIYEEKGFERMPVLGDALEEAGCTDEQILAHCRG